MGEYDMNFGCFGKKIFLLILPGFVGLAMLTGCTSEADYVQQADLQVYTIIDQKWDQDFGTKVNYKISDVEPQPQDIEIPKELPEDGILTLSQAVSLATAHNRQYQLEKENLYIKALDLTLVRHEFDPILFGVAGTGYERDFDREETISTGASFGFTQLLATGARVGASLSTAWVHVISGDTPTGLAMVLNAAFTQPLLRGSDREVVLENLTQAEQDTLYQIRTFNRFRKVFVVSVISQYYRVLEQQERLKNAEDNHEVLTKEYERMKKLAAVGRLPLFELDQAKQDQLQAQDIYIQEQKQYQQLIDEFKIELSLPTTVELQLDENELEALRTAGIVGIDFAEF